MTVIVTAYHKHEVSLAVTDPVKNDAALIRNEDN